MGSLLVEWGIVILRWAHVMAGIGWIGTSFYFVALDAGLKPSARQEKGVGGEAWQVHGGGFYHVQKYLVAPDFLPVELVWFKWEAYATWLFGFALLLAAYYVNPGLYLVDRSVHDMSGAAASAIGLGSLAGGWLVYDGLCRSPLGRNLNLLAAIGFVLLLAVIWSYCHLFGGRAAFIHVGALVGTIMAGNVVMVIIPNQKKIVAALREGRTPLAELGRIGKQRSMHNNYLTLPVVFIMLSGHTNFAASGRFAWLALALVFIAGFCVRIFFNRHHRGEKPSIWAWPAAATAMLAAFGLTLPPQSRVAAPNYARVQAIIGERCLACHSAHPYYEGMSEAPKGVIFDTPDQIASRAAEIKIQAVDGRAMPLGNLTGMTEEERRELGAWIAEGAKIP